MARKKSRKKPPPPKKRNEPLPKFFDCPFCSQSGTIEITIDKKEWSAAVKCRVCDEKWDTKNVTELSHPVDIFNEFIDQCTADDAVGGASAKPLAYSLGQDEYQSD